MDSIILTRILFIICWLISTTMYLIASHKQSKRYSKWKETWYEISGDNLKRIRLIDLEEQYRILMELHEIQEIYPNVSRHDTAMMNTINDYIEKTARQMRYLESKNEPSEKFDKDSDNS